MSPRRVYLDHNATSPLRPAAVDAMSRALALWGNASSIHAEGRAARALIEDARDRVAALVGAEPRDVIFTSGGTEAANTVLVPRLRRASGRPVERLLMSSVEHACVLGGHAFGTGNARIIRCDQDGRMDLSGLNSEIALAAREGAMVLLSLQAANNETGVLQPVTEAAAVVREAGGLVHTDAVQAAGKIKIDMAKLGADVLTLSAHKLGGPQGVGAIVLQRDVELGRSLVRGGGQERGRRAGTENVAAIAGFGAAAEAAKIELEAETSRLAELRDQLEGTIRRIAPDTTIFGAAVARLPNTSAFALPGLTADILLMRLDLDGIAVSSGSACSSGKIKRSHVLDAMGVPPELAQGVIRVSFGWNSVAGDVMRCGAAFERAARSLHMRRSGRQAA